MARGVDDLDAVLAHGQDFSGVEAQVDEWRRARAVHRHGRIQVPGKLLSGRKMVRMRLGVDEVTDAQAVTRSQGGVAIDETTLRIDADGRAAIAAADPAGLATATAQPLD